MSHYDLVYRDMCQDVFANGVWDTDQIVRTKWADGTPAHSKEIFGVQVRLKPHQIPVPTTKQLAWKTAIKEMLIFWQLQSVRKEDFERYNCRVWDEWFLPDNTLGKSYAYQFESRPEKQVVLVKAIESNYKNRFPFFTVSDTVLHNSDSVDQIVGTTMHSSSGPFNVLDVWTDTSYSKNKACKIQFVNTGYIATYPRSEVMRPKVKDPYHKNILGVAARGIPENARFLTDAQIKILYTKWSHMVHRCYNPKDENYKRYGELGVIVSDEWLLFENYVRDIKSLPQWHLAKDDLDNWHLDKDYYGAKLYSKQTCVWLDKKDNDTYRGQSRPFKVVCPDTKEYTSLNTVDVACRHSLSTADISRVLNGQRGQTQVKGYRFEYIAPPTGYLYRHKLSRNQVNELLNGLKHNPASRRLMTSFWNYQDVEEKALQECAFQTQWRVQNGSLHLLLTQRSGDLGLGIPFNQFQYSVLQRMIAQVLNLQVGDFVHQIGSLHIYDRHINPLQTQIGRNSYDEPSLWINPDVKNFDDFTIDDFKVLNYTYHPKIDMEIAI